MIRLKQLTKLFAMLIACYFICRILFLAFNYSFFRESSFSQLCSSFFFGLRFDISAICITNLLFILLFLLPLPFSIRQNKFYKGLCFTSFLIPNFTALAANCADLVYFSFTNKRTTFDVFTVMSKGVEGGSLFKIFLVDFWYVFLIWIVLCTTLWFFSKKILKTESAAVPFNFSSVLKETGILLAVIALAFLGFRGGFQLIPIYNATAAEHAEARNVPLVLNTAFSIIKTSDQPELKEFDFMDEKTAAALCPLNLSFTGKTFEKRNVVVLILESFSKEYCGYFNNGKGHTPFLDSLITQSLIFENAYSNGKTSAQGIPSILAGIPSLSEEPYLTSQYGANNINSIASLLKTEGYSTAFYHGGNNGTMGFQAFTGLAGFQQYFGRTEYNNDADFDGQWGIWDEPYLQYFCKQLNTTKQPFCTALFTLSSHHPFELPAKYKNTFAEGEMPISKCIRYTDMALKKFFAAAQKTDWYNNTVFVITADHTGPAYRNFYHHGVGNYSIPILFFDPGKNLKGKNQKLCQQIDIMPSLMDYLGYEKPFFSFGQSALDSTTQGWCINYQNSTYQLISKEYLLQFNGEKTFGYFHWTQDSLLNENMVGKNTEMQSQQEHKTKAILQQYSKSLIYNKMRPK